MGQDEVGGSPLIERVKKWLLAEGFPFEMQVADFLSSLGFSVLQGRYYVDQNANKPREIDVTAQYRQWNGEKGTSLSVTLVIECKYTRDKPWVVLKSNDDQKCSIVGANTSRIAANEAGRVLFGNLEPDNSKAESFSGGPKTTGYSVLAAFRGGGAVDEAFAAPLAVAKACRALAVKSGETAALSKALGIVEYQVWIPVVVVDGPLFSASLIGSREVGVEPITWARLLLKNPDAGGEETSIDIVTEDGLQQLSGELRAHFIATLRAVAESPEMGTDSLWSMKTILKRLANPKAELPKK
jgi:hypothetical protein